MKNSKTKKLAASWCWLLRLVLPWRVAYYGKEQDPFVILKRMGDLAYCRSSDGVIYHLYCDDLYADKFINRENMKIYTANDLSDK